MKQTKPMISLYFGPQASELGRNHLRFEEENIFQEDDPIDHDIIQEDNSIFFDLKSNLTQGMCLVDKSEEGNL